MGNFTTWFENKLKVTRYPLPNEIVNSKAKNVINVSCEYISSCHTVCLENGIKYFWFPMDEISSDIGLNSLFGALQILWIAEQKNETVILHCHAGANRSPTVMESYYFMRTKKHLFRKNSEENKELIRKMFQEREVSDFKNNRLLNNIESGHFPCKSKMEMFLKKCEEWFSKQEWENDFKTESGLNSIKFECRL
jgi:hypothetical protein